MILKLYDQGFVMRMLNCRPKFLPGHLFVGEEG